MTTTLTAVRSRTMPRVNLLPPEIAQRAQFRRIQVGLAVAVLGVCGVVVGAYALELGAHHSADTKLQASRTTSTTLAAQQANYADVRPVYAAAEKTRTSMAAAMGGEVRTSVILNDISLLMPKHVWLSTLHLDITGAAAAAPTTGPGASTGAGAQVGSLTFGGKGFVHNDVAAWLDALATQKSIGSPYFGSSTVTADPVQGDSVTFSSTATLTTDALSQRYTAKAGN